MDYRSTLIRNVEIPATLPSMETLTRLEGSIILKDVETTAKGIRIEGDLLWRGFFQENGAGGGECLWEGAEYFAETIDGEALRASAPPLIEPRVVSLEGEALSESTFRLAFDIRWYDTPEEEQDFYETAQTPERKTATVTPAGAQPESKTAEAECPCKKKQPPSREDNEILSQQAMGDSEFEEKIEEIDKTWREKLKAINDNAPEIVKTAEKTTAPPKREETKAAPAKSASPPQREEVKVSAEVKAEAEESDEPKVKCCPYSAYCLRYYRAQEGDELEKIAEKFSAAVSKLKEYNALEDNRVRPGRMLRIP